MKKDKFINIIERQLNIINEQEPGDEISPESEPVAPETTPTALPDTGGGEDDTSKLKVDYVEMIRKALIMAPKHIDDVDYARLTKIVDTENLEEMQELVSRIVRNNYPHPDL